jgi:hypothetical protein
MCVSACDSRKIIRATRNKTLAAFVNAHGYHLNGEENEKNIHCHRTKFFGERCLCSTNLETGRNDQIP